MSRMMIQAAVTMNQLQHKLDHIGHNLANSETTGYKSRRSEFASLLFQQINNLSDPANLEGRLTPDGLRVGSGAKLGSANIDLSVGSIQETERSLDVALLNKNHLFQIEVTEGNETEIRYTRDGAFYLSPVDGDQASMLVTKDGHPVLGTNGPILIQEGFDAITIQPNGDVLVHRGNEREVVDTIQIVEAARPRLLEAVGDQHFRVPNLEELGFAFEEIIQQPEEMNLLRSNALERSNVDLTEQMTEMLLAQRSYQMNARTITMGDQMLGLINQLR